MYYHSGGPRVVGEFDAEGLHERIDQVVEDGVVSSPWEVQRTLAEDMGLPHASMDEVAGIKWKGLFRPVGFGSITTDGDVNDLSLINDSRGAVDEWHPDDTSGAVFVLPEILTGASRYPTSFLVGRIALPRQAFRRYQFFSYDFWRSEEGKAAIEDSIEKGDATTRSFKPGEVLRVPGGTLHKRNLPDDASGYRYFLRLFPRVNITHAVTEVSRLRPF